MVIRVRKISVIQILFNRPDEQLNILIENKFLIIKFEMVKNKTVNIKEIRDFIISLSIIVMMIIIGIFMFGVHKRVSALLLEIFFPVIPVIEESNFLSRLYGYFW